MINAGTAFADAVSQTSRRFRIKLYDGVNEVVGSVRSAKIHLGSTGPDTFSIGAVYSSYAEIVLDGRETTLEGKELRIDIGVMTDAELGTYTDMTLGYYTALAPAATKYRTTFTACGRIVSKLAVTEFALPTGQTQTLQNVADAITALTGVTIEFQTGITTSGLIEHPITGNCRDALTVLAGAVFGYATETNTGTVKIGRYSCTPTAEISDAVMIDLPELTDINFEITGVQAVTETGAYETGAPINVTIDNNYVTETLFNTFASGLVGIEYRPGSVPLALGDPRIEPSDTLQISVDDEIYVVPCFSIIHTFDGGFQTEIITPAEQEIGEIVGTMSAEVKEAIKTAREAAEQADDARKVAVNYLSRDSTGIMVADLNDGNQTPSTVTGKNVLITAGYTDSGGNTHQAGTEVRDGQKVVASFGETTQIGDGEEGAAYFTQGSLVLKDSGAASVFKVENDNKYSGLAIVTVNFQNPSETGTRFYSYVPVTEVISCKYIDTQEDITPLPEPDPSESFALVFSTPPGRGFVVRHYTDECIVHGWLGTITAYGTNSFSIGFNNNSYGYRTVIIGNDIVSHCNRVIAIGRNLEADVDRTSNVGNAQMVLGRYNEQKSGADTAFLIGTGTSENNRKNALEITTDDELLLYLDENAAASSTDGRLYSALSALGWTGIISSAMMGIKQLLTKLISRVRHLPNYYSVDGGNHDRPTTANIASDNSGGLITFLATGSMSEASGPPTRAGNIIHCNWDNSNAWANQLFLGHGTAGVFHRTQNANSGTTWGDWYPVAYTPQNIPANANLNSYLTPGDYHCPANVTAATVANRPPNMAIAFKLFVRRATMFDYAAEGTSRYRIQTLETYIGDTWVREIHSSDGGSSWTYGDWKNGVPNLGTAAYKSVANNLTTASAGSSVLDAYQGKVLNDKFASYLPKTGGTLSGNLVVSHSDTTESDLRVTNSKVNGALYAATGGGLGIWNSTLGHAVISEDLNGNVSIHNFGSTTRTTASLVADTAAHRYNSIGFEKIGKIVRVQIGILYNLPASTDTTIGTAPAGYRPAMDAQTMVFCTTTGKAIRIRVGTDGVIKAYNYGAAATGNVNMQAELMYLTT